MFFSAIGARGQFVVLLLLIPFFYTISYTLLSYYEYGDQVYYRAYYDAIKGLDFWSALRVARLYIGASDPLSVFFIWLGAYHGIEKTLYISIFNVVLLSLLFCVCARCRVAVMVFLLLITSYYVLVLLTGAERLKFAYILLLISFLYNDRKWGYVFFLLSGLAHFQMLLLVLPVFIYTHYDDLKSFLLKASISRKGVGVLAFVVVTLLLVGSAFYDALWQKVQAYSSKSVGLSDMVGLLLLSFLAIITSENWRRIVVSLMPFFVFVGLLGDERVNMIAVTFFIGAMMLESRMSRMPALLLMAYFSWKSMGFIENVFVHGNGFGVI